MMDSWGIFSDTPLIKKNLSQIPRITQILVANAP